MGRSNRVACKGGRLIKKERILGKKLIYVASPHGGKDSNIKKNAEYCRRVIAVGELPVSPHHALSFMDEETERDVAMEICIKLLLACDEAWFFTESGMTKGMCREEIAARQAGITIREVVQPRQGVTYIEEMAEWPPLDLS